MTLSGAQGPANRPALEAWLKGADARHIFRPGSFPFPADVYDRLDDVIAVLRAAAPPGLALKRKAFQNAVDPAKAFDIRSELLVGALLVRAGFQMQCPDFPDYMCLSPEAVGVEATTRERDDSQKLGELLQASLPADVDVTFKSLPAVIGTPDTLQQIAQEVVSASHSGQTRRVSHESGLELMVGPALDISIDIDEWKTDGDRLIAQSVREVISIVRKKQEQASKKQAPPAVALVLVVDFRRLGSFGGFHVWAWNDAPDRLTAALVGVELDPFKGVVVAISNLQTNAFNGIVYAAPTAPASEQHTVATIGDALLNRRL